MPEINIKTKIKQNEFIKVNYLLLWMKPIVKVFAVFCLLLVTYDTYYSIYDPYFYDRSMWLYFGMIAFWMVMIWFVARRNFRSNKRIQEQLTYTIEDDKFSVTGESFKSEMTWNKVYKIIKTKKWLLVFQSRQSANFIDIHHCDNATMEALNSICHRHQIKNNL